MTLYKFDDYGIKEWHPTSKIVLGFIILYTYISIAAIPLYYAEIDSINANISSYRDAFWLLQMAASTIGFGDVYPTTEIGRAIVAVSFYVGVGIAGFIGATIAGFFTDFTDKSVQNRELRRQNEQIIELLKKQEKGFGDKELL